MDLDRDACSVRGPDFPHVPPDDRCVRSAGASRKRCSVCWLADRRRQMFRFLRFSRSHRLSPQIDLPRAMLLLLQSDIPKHVAGEHAVLDAEWLVSTRHAGKKLRSKSTAQIVCRMDGRSQGLQLAGSYSAERYIRRCVGGGENPHREQGSTTRPTFDQKRLDKPSDTLCIPRSLHQPSKALPSIVEDGLFHQHASAGPAVAPGGHGYNCRTWPQARCHDHDDYRDCIHHRDCTCDRCECSAPV